MKRRTQAKDKPWEGNHYCSGQSTSMHPRPPGGTGCFYALLGSFVLWALAVSAVFMFSGCQAPTSLAVHGLSDHARPRIAGRAWNEVNPGLGVRGHGTNWWAEGGLFENSFEDVAAYGVVGVPLVTELDGFELGIAAGAADYAQGLQPLAFTYARAGWLQVAWSPDVGQYGGTLTTFGLVIPITR